MSDSLMEQFEAWYFEVENCGLRCERLGAFEIWLAGRASAPPAEAVNAVPLPSVGGGAVAWMIERAEGVPGYGRSRYLSFHNYFEEFRWVGGKIADGYTVTALYAAPPSDLLRQALEAKDDDDLNDLFYAIKEKERDVFRDVEEELAANEWFKLGFRAALTHLSSGSSGEPGSQGEKG